MTPEERREWLLSRQLGLGGSDIAGILGISPWSTPLDVWESKVLPLPEEEEQTESMEVGGLIEDFIAQLFTHRTGKKVERRNKTYVHPEHAFCIANIDRYVVGERAGLECKNTCEWMSENFGEEYTDQIPLYYLTQVMWYMEVTGYRHWYVAAFIGGNRIRVYRVDYKEEIAKGLVNQAVKFWNNHVITKVQPDPVNLDDIKKLYAKADLESINTNDIVTEELDLYVYKKGQAKVLNDEINEHKFNIQKYMGDHNALIDVDGTILCTWKLTKSGNRSFLPKKKKD